MRRNRPTLYEQPSEAEVLATRIETTRGAARWPIHDSTGEARKSFENREGAPGQLVVISEEDNGGKQDGRVA
jgi:hypothetical protein